MVKRREQKLKRSSRLGPSRSMTRILKSLSCPYHLPEKINMTTKSNPSWRPLRPDRRYSRPAVKNLVQFRLVEKLRVTRALRFHFNGDFLFERTRVRATWEPVRALSYLSVAHVDGEIDVAEAATPYFANESVFAPHLVFGLSRSHRSVRFSLQMKTREFGGCEEGSCGSFASFDLFAGNDARY